MSRINLDQMSSRERQIFDILVRLKSATLTEILGELENAPTRQAVRALLTIMERKDYVSHVKSGREFVFSPAGSSRNAARSMFRDVVDKVFGKSLKDALASHLEDEDVQYSTEELREIEALLKKHQLTEKK